MKTMRLQVLLAQSGVASRRKAAEIIRSGKVKVNGAVVTERGFRVNPLQDQVLYDNSSLLFKEAKCYYILNKPSNVLSTVKDERGRENVVDYVTVKQARLYPVGRLDKETTGLIILTNDGELTYRLTHPRFEIDRVYRVKVRGAIREEGIERLKKGILIDGKQAKAKTIALRKRYNTSTVLQITLREGKKREVRRMFDSIGHSVIELKRISYGPIKLGNLAEGKSRALSGLEIKRLKECVGISK